MKKTQRFVALMLALIAVLSLFAVPAFATSTQKKKIVSWSCVYPGRANTNTFSYSVKGNILSEKKVTVTMGSTASSTFGYDSSAINFYKNNARFTIKIYKNGSYQRGYSAKLGQYFYLPKGNSTYTVVVSSYYTNWNGNSSACWNAANGGTYFLNY